jgi:hypothetical protein
VTNFLPSPRKTPHLCLRASPRPSMVQGRQATPHDGTSTAGLPGSSFLFLHNVPLRAYRRRLTALALNHYGTGLVQDKQKPRQIRQTRMGYVVIKLIQAVEKRPRLPAGRCLHRSPAASPSRRREKKSLLIRRDATLR